jgi:hypothetical protein
MWWQGDGGNEPSKVQPVVLPANGWWEADRWLSTEQIEVAVNQMSAVQLRDLFGGDGAWYRKANGPEICRAALRRLISIEDPAKGEAVVFDWVRRESLTVATRANLLREVAEVLAVEKNFDATVLASLARGFSETDLKALMEGWLFVRPTESPETATEFARQWLVAAGLADHKNLDAVAQSVALVAWMKRDPERAIRFAAKSDPQAVRSVLVAELRRALAVDPPTANRLLRTAVESGVYPAACGESAFKAGFTPAQLRAALDGLPVEKFGGYLELYAWRMHDAAPDELMELAKAFPARDVFALWNGEKRVLPHGLFAIATGLARTDPAAAREWLSTLSEDYRLRVLQGVWGFPALRSGRFAELCVEDPKFFNSFTGWKAGVFEALADGSLDAATRALDMVPQNERQDIEVDFRFSKIVNDNRGNLALALGAVESAPENLRAEIRDRVIRSFAEEHPAQLRKWLESHPDERADFELHLLTGEPFGKDGSKEDVIAPRLKENPSDAKAWNWANGIGRFYAYNHPISGIAWLERLPIRSEMYPLVREMAAYGFLEQREVAAEWVKNLPAGPFRDEASAGIAQAIRYEPEEAIAWTESVADEEKRAEVVRSLVDAWMIADSTQALKFIERISLPESRREELRSKAREIIPPRKRP